MNNLDIIKDLYKSLAYMIRQVVCFQETIEKEGITNEDVEKMKSMFDELRKIYNKYNKHFK